MRRLICPTGLAPGRARDTATGKLVSAIFRSRSIIVQLLQVGPRMGRQVVSAGRHPERRKKSSVRGRDVLMAFLCSPFPSPLFPPSRPSLVQPPPPKRTTHSHFSDYHRHRNPSQVVSLSLSSDGLSSPPKQQSLPSRITLVPLAR